MVTPLVPSGSEGEVCLHSGKSWEKLLCTVFLNCALRKTLEIYNRRPYLLTTVLDKEPDLQASLDQA